MMDKHTEIKNLHSSRMRTARALTVSHSMLAGGGGCLPRGVSAPGGVCSQGGLLPGGVCSWGGVSAWGVSAPGGSALGGVCSRGGVRYPPVNRITDACKNITLPNFVAGGNE